ncbi:MAG: hypothetical protein K6T34_04590 [Thermoflavifilum sp.]|nr:hypothetical protein [Thermoflavifilum sp.]
MMFVIASCKRTSENSRTVVYIVPHGEAYPGFNGSLTWYGRLRAGDLMRWLRDSSVQRIYFNPFARCEHMADSLRAVSRVDTAYFRWDDSGKSLWKSIEQHDDFGRRLLVIALPQEIPGILHTLHVDSTLATFPDTAFDVAFIVRIDHGKVSYQQTRYGLPPKPPGD